MLTPSPLPVCHPVLSPLLVCMRVAGTPRPRCVIFPYILTPPPSPLFSFLHTLLTPAHTSLRALRPAQVLRGEAYSHRCDVWSFGIVIWELCTALVPFDGLSSEDVARKVAVEGLRLPPPAATPRALMQMMALCWAPPARRPDMRKLLQQLVAMLEEHRVAVGSGAVAA